MKEQTDILPKIKRCKHPPDRITYEQKCMTHEKILLRYLNRAINGWSVADFLGVEKINEYALYAITDFTEIVCDDLEHAGYFVPKGICDKRASEYPDGYKGRKVMDIDELTDLYFMGKIRKIIILSVLHENEIIDSLLCRGIALNDLISIVSILYA
ncbi:MAG TPA: hypothetical protein DF613_01145 [Lachnospiraceae bacterium]|nr:hypothetical protein [Lachnospiraceae bacterium]